MAVPGTSTTIGKVPGTVPGTGTTYPNVPGTQSYLPAKMKAFFKTT